jgi:type VI secretion system secreted protein Hcp
MSAADFFLKIDEIEGESKDDKLKNQLQLKSWSWGETNSASQPWGGGGGTGKVSMQDFHFVITVGKHSPKLMEACATGKHVGNAVLTCRKAGGEQEDFLIYKFYDLLISSYQTGGSDGSGELPVDQCSFGFSKIEYEYKEQTEKGTTSGTI